MLIQDLPPDKRVPYTEDMSQIRILMSIQTRYAKKIFCGEKQWEFRKSLPRCRSDDKLTVVVYSSGGERSIVGEFRVGRIVRCPLNELMRLTGYDTDERAVQWFSRYYAGQKRCGALEILAPVRYDQPISLSQLRQVLPAFRPPQNFWYIWPGSELAVLLNGISVMRPDTPPKPLKYRR